MKKISFILFVFYTFFASAQNNTRHDLSLNMAGFLIKNQATIAPALLYKYSIKNYQVRFQLSLDGNFLDKDRDSKLRNNFSGDKNERDSAIKYDPGKYIKYGVMAGIQKNERIENSSFSYFYGLDYFYMITDYSQTGKGTVIVNSFGSKQNSDIKVSNKNKLSTFGIGIPLGINYKFGKGYYISFETKFIIACEKSKRSSFTENIMDISNQGQAGQKTITNTESISKSTGFDLSLKPLSGLCIGLFF